MTPYEFSYWTACYMFGAQSVREHYPQSPQIDVLDSQGWYVWEPHKNPDQWNECYYFFVPS